LIFEPSVVVGTLLRLFHKQRQDQTSSSRLNSVAIYYRVYIYLRVFLSVTDPGCLSRIPDPDFYPSRIPDPKTATKESGEKKLDVKPFYVATKFNKIVNYFSFEVLKKKIRANFQSIIELFSKKIVKKLFKIWSWDPGSGI
jgi:hypothetical protein